MLCTQAKTQHEEEVGQKLKKKFWDDYDELWRSNMQTDQTRVLYEYYDLTDARVKRLFKTFDKTRTGK